MNDMPLADLLDRVKDGDRQAEQELFQRYEPYLRMIIRRQISPGLRAKLDSVDIVQSVWTGIFKGVRDERWNFEQPEQFKAFLVRAARNRLIDHVRRNRQSIDRRQYNVPLEESPDSDPRPSEVLYADDTWQQLITICGDSHRPILEMKREGLSLDEIAIRTGFHKSSVRRILYDLSRKLMELRQSVAE